MTIENVINEVFEKVNIDFDKLILFGFTKRQDCFYYSRLFYEDSFEARVFVDFDKKVTGYVYDVELGEPFYQLNFQEEIGSFSKMIKDKYVQILIEIKNNCGDILPFKSNQANRIANLVYEKYNEKVDFPFKDGEAGVFRSKINQKWYGIVMNVLKSKVTKNILDNCFVDVINVKVKEDKYDKLITKQNIYKAYHMANKKWISLILDDSLNDEKILDFIDESRSLVIEKGGKK